jgi:hypothetical protein
MPFRKAGPKGGRPVGAVRPSARHEEAEPEAPDGVRRARPKGRLQEPANERPKRRLVAAKPRLAAVRVRPEHASAGREEAAAERPALEKRPGEKGVDAGSLAAGLRVGWTIDTPPPAAPLGRGT